MSFKSIWRTIGDAFTLQSLLFFLFPAGIIVGSALWLSAATAFVSLFAPLSYLLVALIALLLCILLVAACLTVAKQVGWKPGRSNRRSKTLPRNAELKDVVAYVAYESTFARNVNAKTPVGIVTKEIMDRVAENEMAVWGRIGNLPISRIGAGDLPYCTLNIGQLSITRGGEWGATEFKDVQLNWKQVRATWPKPSFWRRIARRFEDRPKHITAE